MLDRVLCFIGLRRPMIFFGLPGTFLLLAGLVWGTRVVDVFQRKHAVLVGSAIVSVSLCIGGVMALFTGVILRTVRDLRARVQARKAIVRRSGGGGQVPPFIDRGRPLFVFGLPGALMLLIGLLWGAWVVSVCQRTHAVLVGSALISVSLCIGGVMAIFTCIVLHSLREFLLDLEGPLRNKR